MISEDKMKQRITQKDPLQECSVKNSEAIEVPVFTFKVSVCVLYIFEIIPLSRIFSN